LENPGTLMIMTEISQEFLDSVRSAGACLADVRALAKKLGLVPASELESTLWALVEEGEERALSRLLQVCAFREIRLDPELLCRCICVTEELPDTAPCFGLQDGGAVEPLLRSAVAEELSWECQAYAARLAAELTLRFNLELQPVRKVLWKLQSAVWSPEARLLVDQALEMLEQRAGTAAVPHWIQFRLSDLLPERTPRGVVGGSYTVRRPIPKLGRNDPCHCGSGKKYKKCCFAKDQERLRDASAYAGTTRSELKSKPALVDDPAVIAAMRAFELKKLTPSDLGPEQLIAGYRRALVFGLRELAFEMLKECERRPGKHEFDPGHFEDLIEAVLEAGDLELARKIRFHHGDDWYRPHAIQFRFDLLEQPQRFAPLEAECGKSVCGVGDEEVYQDEPLIRLAYDFAPRFPALAVVFARAAIVSNPDRLIDAEALLELIGEARVELDLQPDPDPAEALFQWLDERDREKVREIKENKEIKALSGQLETARDALDEKRQALREMEREIEAMGSELDRARASARSVTDKEKTPQPIQSGGEETLRRMQERVEGLKAEIGEQQAQRRQLRRMLEEERKKHRAPSRHEGAEEPTQREEDDRSVEPSGRPLLPEYTGAFRKNCQSVPPALAAKAILAIGRFASHEQSLWRQTKAIERLPEHYRIRLGRDYRIIVQWQPGEVLRVLDLIPRQGLEAWIKRHG